MTIKILTIEDDERIRTAVRFALEDEGWSVLEAETGEQALEVFNSMTPDLVLVDICLLYTSPSPRDVEESRMPSSA